MTSSTVRQPPSRFQHSIAASPRLTNSACTRRQAAAQTTAAQTTASSMNCVSDSPSRKTASTSARTSGSTRIGGKVAERILRMFGKRATPAIQNCTSSATRNWCQQSPPQAATSVSATCRASMRRVRPAAPGALVSRAWTGWKTSPGGSESSRSSTRMAICYASVKSSGDSSVPLPASAMSGRPQTTGRCGARAARTASLACGLVRLLSAIFRRSRPAAFWAYAIR
jgi:hypothetical protein